MKFGSEGCLENPQGAIVSTLRPRQFPAISRHGVLWLWLGNPDEADPSHIPNLSFIASTPEHAIFKRHLPVAAGHQLLVDNILDLSHADFLHPATLGGGSISAAKTSVKQENARIVSRWDLRGYPCLPIFRLTMPTPDTITDGFIEVTWYPSGVMTLENAAKPVGHPGHSGYHVMSCHVMTPADAANTHYFYAVARDFKTEDAAFNEQMAAGFYGAFADEDKPIAEAQQAVLGGRDLMDLDPKMMACDRGAVTARRIFKRLLQAEQVAPGGEAKHPAGAFGS
jgi:vanillate O-demethylase monooxygenase subunit